MDRKNISSIDLPGSFIEEEIEARGWSQVDLAYILGMSPQQLSPILKGKHAITSDMAVSLGAAFDMPAEFFANLQKQYDLSIAKTPDPGVQKRSLWQAAYPVREMIRRGWIEDSDPGLLEAQMLRFFERNHIDDVPIVGGEMATFAHAARKEGYAETTAEQYAWLYRVRHIARMIEAPKYSSKKLRSKLESIRSCMIDPEEIGAIPEILLTCGIRFVLVEALSRSKIDGVCLWLGRQPVIGISTRLDRLDNFCFVLRHEIEHVLQGHGKEAKYSPVDEFDSAASYDTKEGPVEERMANAAAVDFCISQPEFESFLTRKGPYISEQDVVGFAARMEIHPAVVVGQVQHRLKKWNWLRKYLVKSRKHLERWKFVDGWGHVMAPPL